MVRRQKTSEGMCLMEHPFVSNKKSEWIIAMLKTQGLYFVNISLPFGLFLLPISFGWCAGFVCGLLVRKFAKCGCMLLLSCTYNAQQKQPKWQRSKKIFLKFTNILYLCMHNTAQGPTGLCKPWGTPVCIFNCWATSRGATMFLCQLHA